MLQLVHLTKRTDFLRLARDGRKAVASGLVLQVAPLREPTTENSPKKMARIGFTVSGKVGNAVVRNRIRRRLRAAVAEIFPRNAMPGFDYVVIGRKAALKRPYEGLVKDLKYTLHNTGAFHAENSRTNS